jgi:hypothetical protein
MPFVPQSALVAHSTHPPEKQNGVMVPMHWASLVQVLLHVPATHTCGAWQSAVVRQSTQTCMVGSQTPIVQSAFVMHSTQTPLLQTAMVQSAFVVQAVVHTCPVVSHVGICGFVQSALVRQSTQRPLPVSHTCMKGWQSALVVQPLHTPILQNGVAPPHCASLVHPPPPLLLLLLLLLVPVPVVVTPLPELVPDPVAVPVPEDVEPPNPVPWPPEPELTFTPLPHAAAPTIPKPSRRTMCRMTFTGTPCPSPGSTVLDTNAPPPGGQFVKGSPSRSPRDTAR